MGIFVQCRVCQSQHRAEVDKLLAEGIGLRDVAARFNFSVSSVGRHRRRHLGDDVVSDEGEGLTRLIGATERALHRAERRGDSAGVMSSLRLLSDLKKRHRIHSAASPSASPVQQPHGEKRDPQELVQRLREIYHLTGPNWDVRIKERDEHDRDAELFARLKELVERTEYERPRVAAAATYLGSLLIGERPDEETMAEIKKLLLEGDDENGTAELVDETDEGGAEGIDTGPSNGGDERHRNHADADEAE